MIKDKKLNIIYAILSLGLLAASIVIGIWLFYISYCRTEESIYNLGEALRFYFMKLANMEVDGTLGVNDYSLNIQWNDFYAPDIDSVKPRFVDYWNLFIDKNNFLSWAEKASVVMGNIGKVIVIGLPVVLLIWFLIKKLYFKENNKYNEDTLPLKIWKHIDKLAFEPTRNFIYGYIRYLKDNGPFMALFTIVWLINLNVVTIILEFLAFYFYFVVTFQVKDIYVQIVKLAMDCQYVVKQVPILAPTIGLIVFYKIRRARALDKLDHMEQKNRGFINSLPIVSMTCGSMGKKKTTIITDMALSQEVMFRGKALELLKKIDMKFPHFPWILFEKDIQACMQYRQIYNLATAKHWVRKKRERFEKKPENERHIYNYDIERYGYEYDDALKVISIWDAMESYAQLYFIYIIQSSLIVSNYSIREDNQIIDVGNFPQWNSNFFPSYTKQNSRYAHILDFDTLRLGKQVIENNINSGSFEFGVVNISEVGKERGNTLELKEVKKGEFVTNQKNDLFNSWLKMCRHSATVENYPFIKVFTDEQRPESWGADARDLCDVLNIIETSEQRLAGSWFWIEDMFFELISRSFYKFYDEMRFLRGDNTLLVHIFKSIAAFAFKLQLRIYNKYGYSVAFIEKERGTMDGDREEKQYYVLNKKIYSDRFSTDCFSDYFNDRARKTTIGLDDYEEYMTTKASVEELKKQNSYFINSLYKDE